MAKTYGVGIMGAGNISSAYLRLAPLFKGIEVRGVADIVPGAAKARGVSEKDYMSGNLLGREVTADDVADAFVFLALARKTTAAVVTVDGGNIEASLR